MDGHVCPNCGSAELEAVLTRERAPVLQNTLYRSTREAMSAVTGRIVLASCGACGFVFNAAFDPSIMIYDAHYENDQSFSPTFVAHMNAMADRVLASVSSNGGTVVEVGCGQGGFLSLLHRRSAGRRLVLRGFDPSYRAFELPEGVAIAAHLYDEQALQQFNVRPDVMVLRHVIEHIPNPVAFFALLRRTADARPGLRLLVETPCFAWIARNRVMQDVFYEHVNYFTADTLADALARAGFGAAKVTHVFGGQYLWAEATPAAAARNGGGLASTAQQHAMARDYAAGVSADIIRWRSMLADGVPTAVWGAGAKGVTFAGLVDPDLARIACLIDVNPNKQGAWIASTAHAVVSPEEAARRGVRRVLIMNPNYADEIRAQAAQQGWTAAFEQAG